MRVPSHGMSSGIEAAELNENERCGQNRGVPARRLAGPAGAIAPEEKAAYLRKLIEAGFTHIDAVSFVSPAAVPQMADSERVLELLETSEGRRDHRDRGERERRGTGHSHRRGTDTGFSLLDLSRVSAPQSTSDASKNRCMCWKRCQRWPATRVWMWWPIFPWPSEILMVRRGASTR